MIFVTLGTQDKAFPRLLKYLEEANINEKVVVQAGFTVFESKKYDIKAYLDKEEFDECLKQADVIICHGGVGTIMNALNNHKKVIACARLSKYGEHQNDHQTQIIGSLVKQGYILELNEDNRLDDLLEEIKTFKVPDISSNQMTFVKKLEDYIDSL